MATVTDNGFPNIVNITKRLRPDGSVETMIADTLSKEMPMIEDIPFVEGNLPTGHRITSVTALPAPTWRRFNQGVARVKGQTTQFDEVCGLLEAKAQIDVDLAKLNGNEAAYRQTEGKMFTEGISQEFARALLYASAVTNPEQIHGLAARYVASTGYTASANTLKVGTPGGTACQSIWVVSWDPERVYGIYPKGSMAGLSFEDLGQRAVLDANNNEFEAYVGRYVWKPGLCVKDWRFVVRLQWDTTDATNCADSAKGVYIGLTNALTQVRRIFPSTRIYWSRVSRQKVLAQLASNDVRYLETVTDPNYGIIDRFLGVPARITDSLANETAIS